MTLLEIYNYFEAYAAGHKLLQHVPDDPEKTAFIAADAEEEGVDELIRKCARERIMVFIPYEKKMLPVRVENFNWGKSIVFLVIKKVSRGNEKEKIIARSECEEILDDFCRQVINDRTAVLTTVDLESFFMQPVGPISDDRYGYICMFSLTDYFDQTRKPERWQA